MSSISDIIERYLKKIINESEDGVIEIKRSELADIFQCVPSQINYVISTRFTVEKGYIVESKRGGGGFIRIQKVRYKNRHEIFDEMLVIYWGCRHPDDGGTCDFQIDGRRFDDKAGSFAHEAVDFPRNLAVADSASGSGAGKDDESFTYHIINQQRRVTADALSRVW